MARPRSVPWASRAELVEMYELLFAPDSDAPTRARGIARMCVYLASPSCPAFLPLLHSLVSVAETPEPRTPDEKYRLRLVCAMAMVRFVNGMVDPLQTGPYARPIAHIAASLGIPPSLISLRHRATHEDLPPLLTLQQAVRMAIQYIHDFSFIPLIAEPSQLTSRGTGRTRGGDEATKLVKRWKRATKSRLRDKDVGEETFIGREIRAIKKDLERVDTRDVIDALVGEGGLVPLALSKRPTLTERSPGTASIQIWTPLLHHLAEANPDVVDAFCQRILDEVTPPFPGGQSGNVGSEQLLSYHWGLATWLLHLWTSPDSWTVSMQSKKSIWKQLLASLINESGVVSRLYQALLDLDPTLHPLDGLVDLPEPLDIDDDMAVHDRVIDGLETTEVSERTAGPKRQSKLDEMQRRLESITSTSSRAIPLRRTQVDESEASLAFPLGWRRLSRQESKTVPIGIWNA